MTLFSRLFKSKKPVPVEQQIEQLNTLSETELFKIIEGDSVTAIKQAAIMLLPYTDKLLEMAHASPSHPLEVFARKRIGALLDHNVISVQQLSERISDQATLLILCGYASEAGSAFLAAINDEALLALLAKEAATTAVRQAAAERVESEIPLNDVLKVAKNKDKAVYKLVKNKLEKFKLQRAQRQAINEEGQSLIHQLTALSKRNVDDIFVVRLNQIQEQWMALKSDIDPAILETFTHAEANCQTKISEHETKRKAQEAKALAEKEAKRELFDTIDLLEHQLAALLSGDAKAEDAHDVLADAQKRYEAATHSAEQAALNTSTERTLFNTLSDEIKRLIDTISNHGAFADNLAQLQNAEQATAKALTNTLKAFLNHAKALPINRQPAIIEQARQALSAFNKAAQAKQAQFREDTDEAYALIRRATGAIRAGQVRRARAIFRDLNTKLEALESIPKALEDKYQDLKANIEKLGDWQDFAVAPKKEALLQQMESLVESTLHPKDLSEKIKSLQEDWKALSKGAIADDDNLWQAFQSAGQKAYEPCKQYYEEQAKLREGNLAKRQLLLSDLKQYLEAYDWDNAHWPDVEKTLRVSREAWQSYWPVPRKPNKNLQEAFDQTAEAIHQKVLAQYDRNKDKKQAIVTQAEQLLKLENTVEAIETAKKLQSQWKAIGRCHAKQDHALWQAFRQHCDAIFDRRKQESDSEKAQRNTAKTQAEALIAQLEGYLTLSGEAFTAARSDINTASEQFKQLGELPRAHYKDIQQSFQKVSKQLEAKAQEARKLREQKQWHDILDAYREVLTLEAQGAQGENVAERMSNLRQRLTESTHWPADLAKTLEQRLQKPQPISNATATLKAYHRLCIRSEIANDCNSPDADRSLRMEYQVEQLQQGLGQRQLNARDELLSILQVWFKTPMLEDIEQYSALEQRLLATWGLPPNTHSPSPEAKAPA